MCNLTALYFCKIIEQILQLIYYYLVKKFTVLVSFRLKRKSQKYRPP